MRVLVLSYCSEFSNIIRGNVLECDRDRHQTQLRRSR